MKLNFKIGSDAKVIVGKYAGKQAKVVAIDKRSNRVRLDGLKVVKAGGKKGGKKDLHGTFHVSSLVLVTAVATEESAA